MKADSAGCVAKWAWMCVTPWSRINLAKHTDFGKMPTSAALVVREAGAADLSAAFRKIINEARGPRARARAMEELVCRVWHVHQKLAAMYLALLTNPDPHLGFGTFTDGIDWRHFVVVDSNVTNFLEWIGYRGYSTYDARRAFVRALAAEIDLGRLDAMFSGTNPRLTQQAFYIFASATNRRAIDRDCSHLGPTACVACPRPVATLCPLEYS